MSEELNEKLKSEIQNLTSTPEITLEEAEKQGLFAALEIKENPPEDVWVPNRAARRAMKKNAKKGYKNLLNASNFAKGAALAPEQRQDLYKAAYEKLKNYKTDEYRHQAKG